MKDCDVLKIKLKIKQQQQKKKKKEFVISWIFLCRRTMAWKITKKPKDKHKLGSCKKKPWSMKMTAIPIIDGTLGTVPNSLEQKLEKLEIKERINTIQTTALLRLAGVLTRNRIKLLYIKKMNSVTGRTSLISIDQKTLKICGFCKTNKVVAGQIRNGSSYHYLRIWINIENWVKKINKYKLNEKSIIIEIDRKTKEICCHLIPCPNNYWNKNYNYNKGRG